jgi:protein gp37
MPTAISWTDEVWNPVVGCSRISEGCVNCYAATAAASTKLQQFEQYQTVKQWDGTVSFVEKSLLNPLRWRSPKKIFVCSMSDLFHENILDEWRDRIFAVMAMCPQHTFQVLTKRPKNAVKYFEMNPWHRIAKFIEEISDSPCIGHLVDDVERMGKDSYLNNAWIGVTVENQKMADLRIPLLLQIPSIIKWLSMEPLLGAISLKPEFQVDWAVIGGESGRNYRPMQIDWLEKIVYECQEANVKVFVKQDSAYQPGKQSRITNDFWSIKQFP